MGPAAAMQPLLEDFAQLELGRDLSLLMCRYNPAHWYAEAAADAGVSFPDGMECARPKRLTEFLAGRVLAQELLRKNGCKGAVGRCHESRAPLWPSGFTGSITHSRGLAACCVLPTADVATVGIDAEHWLRAETADRVSERIWSTEERDVFLDRGWDPIRALTTVFSVKESLFKALYPLCHEFFGFDAVQVRSVSDEGTSGRLAVELRQPVGARFLPGLELTIAYRTLEGCIVTGLALTHKTP